jgi:hypothetical protein
VEEALRARSRALQFRIQALALPLDSLYVPLTTVSMAGSFDSYIDIQYEGATASAVETLIVDSGNTTLIVPQWETIAALPNYTANYTIVGAGTEPWGCPANLVRGPINLSTITNDIVRIDNCVFYACTGDSPASGTRTANFGTGCISPWSASGWNTPPIPGVVMQPPLSYNPTYPLAEFSYAPASAIHDISATPKVASGSYLGLHKSVPPGFRMFNIMPNLEWMCLAPKALSIGTVRTNWPGALNLPIAMIDTGGTCAFLSDPNGDLYTKAWPDPVANPGWTSSSQSCESISDAITIELGDPSSSYAYTIDTSTMPASVQGLTLVMCQRNSFMMGENGMNIGGISALMNTILIDYADARVGLKPK